MHEYSIVRALLDRVESEARARGALAVHRVRVRLGELSGIEAELFATAYSTFREGTICRGADLEIVAVPCRWVCRQCEQPIGPGEILRCASCGGPARLAGGDEVLLDRIEMEVP